MVPGEWGAPLPPLGRGAVILHGHGDVWVSDDVDEFGRDGRRVGGAVDMRERPIAAAHTTHLRNPGGALDAAQRPSCGSSVLGGCTKATKDVRRRQLIKLDIVEFVLFAATGIVTDGVGQPSTIIVEDAIAHPLLNGRDG